MEVLELWEKFVTMHPEAKDSTYEVWAFGSNPSMADSLLALVLEGKRLEPVLPKSYLTTTMNHFPRKKNTVSSWMARANPRQSSKQ